MQFWFIIIADGVVLVLVAVAISRPTIFRMNIIIEKAEFIAVIVADVRRRAKKKEKRNHVGVI